MKDEVNNDCRKLANALEQTHSSLNDLNKKSSHLWDNLSSAQNDCDALNLNLKQLKSSNNSKLLSIS